MKDHSIMKRCRPVASIGAIVGVVLAGASPAPVRARVLIDDTLSAEWGPAARRLDQDWYGDFATYGFAGATEALSHLHEVDVNTARLITPELCNGYDVIVIKTPTRKPDANERIALREFVLGGGGLVCIGDHTNLLGIGSALNSLVAEAGITFLYDAVSTVDGGALVPVVALDPGFGPSSLAGAVTMSPCSLRVNWPAQALAWSGDSRATTVDYSESSNFGRLRNDTRNDVGPKVLVAKGRLGKGRIVAIADSTWFSTFAMHDSRHFGILERSIQVASADGRIAWVPAVLLGIWVLIVRWGPSNGRLAEALAGGVVLWLCNDWRWSQLPVDHDRAIATPTVAVVTEPSTTWIPPALGVMVEERYLAVSYDTWMTSFFRLGVRPCWYDGRLPAATHRPLVLWNLGDRLAKGGSVLARQTAALGADVVIGWPRNGGDAHAMQLLCEPLGIDVSERDGEVHLGGVSWETVTCGEEKVTVGMRKLDSGRIWIVIGIEVWSRGQLGHSMSVPNVARRNRYALLFQIFGAAMGGRQGDRRTYGILE